MPYIQKKLIQTVLSEVPFADGQFALIQTEKVRKETFPFVTMYQRSVCSIKEHTDTDWDLIQNQPLLKKSSAESTYYILQKVRSLQDMLVRAKVFRLCLYIASHL